MTNILSSEQIKNCCGVYLLHNFFKNDPPSTIEAYGRTEADRRRNYPSMSEEQIATQVALSNKTYGRETKEQYLARIRRSLDNYIASLKNKKSYYLAILNESEASELESILLDVGFEILVPMTKNPTGSSIVMYIYHLLPRPLVKKVVESVIPRSRETTSRSAATTKSKV